MKLDKIEKFFTKFWLIITIICFLLIAFSIFVDASGDKIGLEWDANTEPNLAGYNIYVSYDQGGPYELIGTNASDDIDFYWYGILSDADYYFVVTAFNYEGLESNNSNEVCGYINFDKDYGIECGTEYPSELPPETPTEYPPEKSGGGGGGGCFISLCS